MCLARPQGFACTLSDLRALVDYFIELDMMEFNGEVSGGTTAFGPVCVWIAKLLLRPPKLKSDDRLRKRSVQKCKKSHSPKPKGGSIRLSCSEC